MRGAYVYLKTKKFNPFISSVPKVNPTDTDQKPQNAAFDQGLHRLHKTNGYIS